MAAAIPHTLTFRSLSRQPPTDPDIQSTLADFLGYTEHFPSLLTRGLTLIEELRDYTEEKIASINHDADAWSSLPTWEAGEDADEQLEDGAAVDGGLDALETAFGSSRGNDGGKRAVELRKRISYALEGAEDACRMAAEESVRLDETCERERRRLDTITQRLRALPWPPSRDPTPTPRSPTAQRSSTSPIATRERRFSNFLRADVDTGPSEKKTRRLLEGKAATKLRGRKIMVPGEVLPPPDPNAPVESMSEWSSPRPSPSVIDEDDLFLGGTERKRQMSRPRSRTPKLPKADKHRRKQKSATPGDLGFLKPRGPRPPGQPGTNAHSSVAGISTANALLALTQPPEEAPKGSRWLPWMKLTEWEMAKLRKRMKKNAIWVPSQTMVRRELKNLGRGVAGKEEAKKIAADGGPAFVDESQEGDPTKIIISGEDTAQINAILAEGGGSGGQLLYGFTEDGEWEEGDQELINRGMRLNEAKKLKRQRMLQEQREQEEQALQAQIAREQGLEIPGGASKGDTKANIAEASKKRKRRDSTPTRASGTGITDTPDPLSKSGPPPRKHLKISGPAPSTKVPLAPAGVSSSPKVSASRNRRAATPTPGTGRKSASQVKLKAVSEEPPSRRISLRRSSNASLPNSTIVTSPQNAVAVANNKGGRRTRRPAPGMLRDTDDGSAKVGVSNRKSAPRKRTSGGGPTLKLIPPAAPPPAGQEEIFEYIDPDEPRYCICGDVSWGTMIGCDNEESCEKEWFHLSCVGLDDLPPRRTKWYCPDCRKKLGVGGRDGLVGRTFGR